MPPEQDTLNLHNTIMVRKEEMIAIDTQDLERKLREDIFFDENAILESKNPDIHILINKHIAEKGFTHADVIRKLNVERSYGYQLLNGKRVPTRIQLIKLCFLLKLTFEETQKLLKAAGKEILYARNVTDAKIMYSIEHNIDYDSACEFVWNEDP